MIQHDGFIDNATSTSEWFFAVEQNIIWAHMSEAAKAEAYHELDRLIDAAHFEEF